MNRTKIQWADYTANPIAFQDAAGKRVWACEKVSAGCANCYASSLNARYHGSEFTAKWMASVTPHLFEADLMTMLKFKPKPPFKAGARPTVFVGDMTDIFGEWVPEEWLDRLFAVFALRPDVDWQVLTKRPERMRAYIDKGPTKSYWNGLLGEEQKLEEMPRESAISLVAAGMNIDRNGWIKPLEIPPWPLPNVWLGTSVEDQQAADSRIPDLLATPAAVRFLSCEPLLGPVGIGYAICAEKTEDNEQRPVTPELFKGLHWIIAGGESGSKARPCDIAWIRDLRGQCEAAGVPVFVKQLGTKPRLSVVRPVLGEPYMYGATFKLRDRHGGDPSEWPEDLRIREFPEVGHGADEAAVRRAQPEATEDADAKAERASAPASNGAAVAPGSVGGGACPCGCGERT